MVPVPTFLAFRVLAKMIVCEATWLMNHETTIKYSTAPFNFVSRCK
jgi:hypothetical protein